MKTVEETKTGLPSFETEWPTKVDTEREPAAGETNWASERLQHVLQSSILESNWRGVQEYDSPLAG